MLEHFGDITMIQEVLQQAQTGLWIIEIEEGKEPRMYADRAMLGLLGLDEEPEPADDQDAVTLHPMVGHVILDHVTFGYDPDKTILKDISLYAKPGQKIAFVGSTGAGKTTITNLLNRFYDIQSGVITIDGVTYAA